VANIHLHVDVGYYIRMWDTFAFSAMLCNGLMCFIMTPTISPMLDIIVPHNETRTKSLAFELDYGIDLQTHWLWLWLHTCTTSSATILNIIGADLIYVTFTLHACYLFVIVRWVLNFYWKECDQISIGNALQFLVYSIFVNLISIR